MSHGGWSCGNIFLTCLPVSTYIHEINSVRWHSTVNMRFSWDKVHTILINGPFSVTFPCCCGKILGNLCPCSTSNLWAYGLVTAFFYVSCLWLSCSFTLSHFILLYRLFTYEILSSRSCCHPSFDWLFLLLIWHSSLLCFSFYAGFLYTSTIYAWTFPVYATMISFDSHFSTQCRDFPRSCMWCRWCQAGLSTPVGTHDRPSTHCLLVYFELPVLPEFQHIYFQEFCCKLSPLPWERAHPSWAFLLAGSAVEKFLDHDRVPGFSHHCTQEMRSSSPSHFIRLTSFHIQLIKGRVDCQEVMTPSGAA